MGCIFKQKDMAGREKSPFWYVKYYRNGKSYIESSKSTIKADAKRLLTMREGQIHEGKFPGLKVLKTTISDLLDFVQKDTDTKKLKSGENRERYQSLLKDFFGPTKASNLTTTQITEYRKKRRSEGVTDSTINRELGLLRRAYYLGMRHDPPLVNRIPNIPLTSERDCVRTGFIEHDEYLALRAVLPDHIKVALTIAYYTGMRQGEILGMQWRQVDFNYNTIRLETGTTKNKEGRIAPIIPEMKEVLERWWMESMSKYPDCTWVIHKVGRKITKHFGKAWKTACKKVGLEGLLFHDLRRSAIRNLVRAEIPQSVAMEISGHKTDAVFRRYDIISEKDIVDAGRKLSQYLNEKKVKDEEMVKKQLKLASERDGV